MTDHAALDSNYARLPHVPRNRLERPRRLAALADAWIAASNNDEISRAALPGRSGGRHDSRFELMIPAEQFGRRGQRHDLHGGPGIISFAAFSE